MDKKYSISARLDKLKSMFLSNEDVVFKEIEIANLDALIVYQKGVCDLNQVGQFILKPLVNTMKLPNENIMEYIDKNILCFPDSEIIYDEKIMSEEILKGKSVVIVDKEKEAIAIGVNKYFERAISEPPTSTVLSGPRK